MVPPPRTGSFSPNPVQTQQSGPGHPPHPSQSAVLSAAASPSTGSPTGSSSLTKIAITQVSLLLSTIKDETDPKYSGQVSQLRKVSARSLASSRAVSHPSRPPLVVPADIADTPDFPSSSMNTAWKFILDLFRGS